MSDGSESSGPAHSPGHDNSWPVQGDNDRPWLGAAGSDTASISSIHSTPRADMTPGRLRHNSYVRQAQSLDSLGGSGPPSGLSLAHNWSTSKFDFEHGGGGGGGADIPESDAEGSSAASHDATLTTPLPSPSLAYRPDASRPGRTSSRYYQRMASRSWIPLGPDTPKAYHGHAPAALLTPVSATIPSPASASAPALAVPSASFASPSAASVTSTSVASASATSGSPRAPLSVSLNPASAPPPVPLGLAAAGPPSSPSSLDGSLGPLAITTQLMPSLSMYVTSPRIFGVQPPQLSGHCCTRVNNSLYIFGGRIVTLGDLAEQRAQETLEVSESSPPLSPPLPAQLSCDLYIYNTSTTTLTRPAISGDIPDHVQDMAATRCGDYIFYVGGRDSRGNVTDSVYALHTVTLRFERAQLRDSSDRFVPRSGHTLVAVNSTHLVLFGGVGRVSDSDPTPMCLNDSWLINVEEGPQDIIVRPLVADPFGARPPPRSGHSVCLVTPDACRVVPSRTGGLGLMDMPEASPSSAKRPRPAKFLVVVYGGHDDHQILDSTWMLDWHLERWCELPTTAPRASSPKSTQSYFSGSPGSTHSCVSAPARTRHSTFVAGNLMVVVGGAGGDDQQAMLLNLKTGTWATRPLHGRAMGGVAGHTGILHDMRYFVFGGDSGRGLYIVEVPLISLTTL